MELVVNTTQKSRHSKEWARRRCPLRTQFGYAICKIRSTKRTLLEGTPHLGLITIEIII